MKTWLRLRYFRTTEFVYAVYAMFYFSDNRFSSYKAASIFKIVSKFSLNVTRQINFDSWKSG